MRFLIAAGNSSSEHDIASVAAWRRKLAMSEDKWEIPLYEPAVAVGYLRDNETDMPPIALRTNRGFIFGRLFEASATSEPVSPWCRGPLREQQADEVIASRGRSLVSRFWGHYVATLYNPRESEIIVLRAPASPMPCFWSSRDSVHLFFSHVADYRRMSDSPLSINWDSVTAQVVGGDYLTAETSLIGIHEMYGGDVIRIRRGEMQKESYWNPKILVSARSTHTFQSACRAVRLATDQGIASLSAPHDNILVTASGGLDSSIVLASLRRAKHQPHLEAINYHSPGIGDERRFARALCDLHRCRLREVARDPDVNLEIILNCNPTARPVLNFSAPDVERRTANLAREYGCTAIFNGELGDNVFGSHPGPGALVEALRQFGPTRRFASSALDYALLTHISFWRALMASAFECVDSHLTPNFDAMRPYRSTTTAAQRRQMLLASDDAIEHMEDIGNRFLHPWLQGTRRVAPGAHMLLFGLINITSTTYHSPFLHPWDPEQLSPLLNQPLIETALAIPAHLHCSAGTDRAVARAAFQDVLPLVIVNRGLGKGGPATWAQDVIRTNAPFLRELLLDGLLVRRGLLDRVRLEAALSPGRMESSVIVGDVFAKAYIETWLRNAHDRAVVPAQFPRDSAPNPLV